MSMSWIQFFCNQLQMITWIPEISWKIGIFQKIGENRRLLKIEKKASLHTFLTAWSNFWRHDICFLYIKMYFPHFLTWWHTFDVITYFLMLRRTFSRHDVLFDIIKYFIYFSRHDVRNFWRYDIIFDIMTYFLMSWHTFYAMIYYAYFWTSWHNFWPYDILFASSRIFGIFSTFCTYWHYDVPFDIRYDVLLTSWRTLWCHDLLLDVITYILTSWSNFHSF